MTKTVCRQATHETMAKVKPGFICNFELENMESIFKKELEKQANQVVHRKPANHVFTFGWRLFFFEVKFSVFRQACELSLEFHDTLQGPKPASIYNFELAGLANTVKNKPEKKLIKLSIENPQITCVPSVGDFSLSRSN